MATLICGLTSVTFSDATYAVQHGLFGNVSVDDNSLDRADSDTFVSELIFYSADTLYGNFTYLWEFEFEKTIEHQDAHTERFHIKYSFADELKLSLGQFHSPIGYWNRTFHHGSILFDTVERPFFLDFDANKNASTVTPVHYIGMMADGIFETDDAQWKYQFGAGNGSEISTNQNTSGDRPEIESGTSINSDNINLSYHLSYHPDEQPYHLGFFVMRNEVQESGSLTDNSITQYQAKLTDQNLYGLEASYKMGNFDLIAEHFWFRHTNQADRAGAYNASAFYIQLGYQFSAPLKAIYRYSQLDLEAGDLYFDILGAEEQYHNVFTLKYELNEFNAIKLEADQQSFLYGAQGNVYTIRLQWSFMWNNPLDAIVN